MPSEWFKRQTIDATKQAKENDQFFKLRKAEQQYAVRLRKLARHVGHIVGAFPPGDPEAAIEINRILKAYAAAIVPWARATSATMLAEVNLKDEQLWAKRTKGMSEALRQELRAAPTGVTLRQMQEEQIKYITSIPLEAAQRVQELTMEGLLSGRRAEEIKKDILRTTHVTESRATLIARTEVGRVSTNLTLARATHIGSEGYIWRTVGDSDVRKSHRALEGTYHRWDNPPVCDPPNYRAHAGAIFNCRCYPEVVIPDRFLK